MKNMFERIKRILLNSDRKKLIENCMIVIIIGIIIIIAGGTLFGGTKKADSTKTDDEKNAEEVSKSITSNQKDDLEKKLEGILEQVQGAGKVSVAVTFSSSKEIVPAYDTKKTESGTEEKDTGGGTRNITQNDSENNIAYEDNTGGVKKAIILKELQPTVKGVVVVADGAGDTQVRENICRAVQVLLDIPVYKIQVLQRSK